MIDVMAMAVAVASQHTVNDQTKRPENNKNYGNYIQEKEVSVIDQKFPIRTGLFVPLRVRSTRFCHDYHCG